MPITLTTKLANGEFVSTAGNYHGSLVDSHGPILNGYDECPCGACHYLEPWQRRSSLKVVVDGVVVRLMHVRDESFSGAMR